MILLCIGYCQTVHPPPPSSIQLHPPRPSSFQPPPSSLQHPQSYQNQNIACNRETFQNIGRKIKSCPFSLKVGTHYILEELIRIQTQIFEILTPKSIFGDISAEKAFPVYSYCRPCCCSWTYSQFWFYILKLKYQYFYCVLVPVLSKFIFTSFCSILKILGFLGQLFIQHVLKKNQNI